MPAIKLKSRDLVIHAILLNPRFCQHVPRKDRCRFGGGLLVEQAHQFERNYREARDSQAVRASYPRSIGTNQTDPARFGG